MCVCIYINSNGLHKAVTLEVSNTDLNTLVLLIV